MIEEKVDKICAFCGKQAQNKSKEHVVPKWLIELTGGNQQTRVGYIRSEGENINIASYQFTIPSCSRCNNQFSVLESKSKRIIEKILNNETLLGIDIPDLLDWLEKTKITSWYSDYYFNKDPGKMKNKISVISALSKCDRMLSIYVVPEMSGVSLWGPGTYGYYLSSTVFGLRFKNLLFVFHSGEFILSKFFTLPYPCEQSFFNYDINKLQIVSLKKNYKPFVPEVCSKALAANITIFQPIINSVQKEFYEGKFNKQDEFKDSKPQSNDIFILKNNILQCIKAEKLDRSRISWRKDMRWKGKELLANYFDLCNYYIDIKLKTIGYLENSIPYGIMKENYKNAIEDNFYLRSRIIDA